MKFKANTLSVLLSTVLLTGCEIWPEHGNGGAAEIRSSHNYYVSEIGYSKEVTTLQRQLSNARLQLDMSVLQGALTCLPASVKSNATLINRVQRELDGELIEDAYADLVILSQSLQQLRNQLAYVSHHTECASADNTKETALLISSILSALTITIQFDLNDSQLSKEYQRQVQDFTQRYQKLQARIPKGLRIHINAHTDVTGSSSDNTALAEQRALSVQAALISAGISKTKITVINNSEDAPLLEKPGSFSHGLNRRVVVSVHRETASGGDDKETIIIKDWERQLPLLFSNQSFQSN